MKRDQAQQKCVQNKSLQNRRQQHPEKIQKKGSDKTREI